MIEEGLRKRRRRYTNVPAATIEDYDNLDCRDLGLLVRMLSKPDGWRFSAKRLSKDWVRDGETVIGTGLRHLAEAGYYRLERRRLLDGSLKMGNAVSEEPVPSWIEDFKAFGGKAVPLVQQPDGTFKVKRPDGTLVGDGFEAEHTGDTEPPPPASESGLEAESSQVGPDTGFPDPVQPDPETGGPDPSGSGEPRPYVSTEGATTESSNHVEPLRGSTCAEDRGSDSPPEVQSSPGPKVIEATADNVVQLHPERENGGEDVLKVSAVDLGLDPADRLAVLDVDFSPAGKRKTLAEDELARKVAHAVVEDWWAAMERNRTPISHGVDGKEFVAMRSMIKARLTRAYTVREVKTAMRRLYERQHTIFPTAQMLDKELASIRKNLPSSAPVPAPRKATTAQRMEQGDAALEEAKARLAELRARSAGGAR